MVLLKVRFKEMTSQSVWQHKVEVLELESTTRISKIKVQLFKRRGGYPPHMMRLYWVGKRLDESQTLESIGVQDASTIFICPCNGGEASKTAAADDDETIEVESKATAPVFEELCLTRDVKLWNKRVKKIKMEDRACHSMNILLEAALFMLSSRSLHDKQMAKKQILLMQHFRNQQLFDELAVDPLTGKSLFDTFRRICAALHPRPSAWPPALHTLSKFCKCPKDIIISDTMKRDGLIDIEDDKDTNASDQEIDPVAIDNPDTMGQKDITPNSPSSKVEREKSQIERLKREKRKHAQAKARKKAKRDQMKKERETRRKLQEEEDDSLIEDKEDSTQKHWQNARAEAIALGKLKAIGETLFKNEKIAEDTQMAMLHAYERDMAEIDQMIAAEELEEKGRDRGGELFSAALSSDIFADGFSDETLRATFDAIDKDGSGELDEEEIANVMASLGKGADLAEVKELIEIADEDGNGVIDFEEFKVLMGEIHRRQKLKEVDIESKSKKTKKTKRKKKHLE